MEFRRKSKTYPESEDIRSQTQYLNQMVQSLSENCARTQIYRAS